MIWFTSDHHFNHRNIIEYCQRPFPNVEQMNAELIKMWNFWIAPDDMVFYLGDFAFGKTQQIIEYGHKLNGFKVLVRGNHDMRRTANCYLRAGFSAVLKELRMRLNGYKLFLTHDPRKGLDPVEDGYFCIHGHVHNRYKTNGRFINVGVDAWGMMPVSETTLSHVINAKVSGRWTDK